MAAAFLLAAYVSGYLIVSIYDSSFGFTELNPLKPKILGAGVLFSFLTAIPVYTAHQLFSPPLPGTTPYQKTASFLSRLFAYCLGCSVITLGLSLIISAKSEPGPLLKLPFHP